MSNDLELDERFGAGRFPDQLDRFNWSALFAGLLWALGHGVWRWALILIAWRISSSVLYSGVTMLFGEGLTLQLAAVIVTEAAGWALLAVFASSANRSAWDAEAKRRASGRAQPPALDKTVGGFLDSQKAWFHIGLVLTIAGYVIGFNQMRGDLGGVWMMVAALAVGLTALSVIAVVVRQRGAVIKLTSGSS